MFNSENQQAFEITNPVVSEKLEFKENLSAQVANYLENRIGGFASSRQDSATMVDKGVLGNIVLAEYENPNNVPITKIPPVKPIDEGVTARPKPGVPIGEGSTYIPPRFPRY